MSRARRRGCDGGGLAVALGLALALATGLALPSVARAEPGAKWLRDRLAFGIEGAGAWRASLGTDPHFPGFEARAGGGEVLAGLEVLPSVAVVVGGRVLAGSAGTLPYRELLGSLGVQLRATDVVRVRVGAAAGPVTIDRGQTVLVGFFTVLSIDLLPLGASGRTAVAFELRLDGDEVVGSLNVLAEQTVALSAALGFRY